MQVRINKNREVLPTYQYVLADAAFIQLLGREYHRELTLGDVIELLTFACVAIAVFISNGALE